MPELPALPLGQPTTDRRETRPSPRPRVTGPGPQVQSHRLGGALQRLTAAFEAQRVAIGDGADAIEPEQVIVLDIAGEIDEFVAAVQRVPGLEFLAEEVEDKVDPDDFAAIDQQGRRRRYARQLFLVFSDQTAWQQLLSLWERFQRGEDFERGLTKFKHLFSLLREVRAWDDRDRLERTGALEAWERELSDADDQLIEFEIELWLRSDRARRSAAVADLRADLEAVGGEFVVEYVNEDIDYHGLLGRAPARRLLEAVADHEVRWLRTGAVRFFHAVGQMAVPATPDDASPESVEAPAESPTAGEARIAVLDGLPLAGHTLLRDRIVIDDPDGWEATIPVARRVHGTAMASVVVHGDLNEDAAPLRSPVYVRPILTAEVPDWVQDAREEIPRDRLTVDVVHAAVARLFEGDEAAAPDVRVVLLAVGDTAFQFDRFISPLARLIDWLSFRYGVLFLVPAGNHLAPLELASDVDSGDPQELQHELLCALGRSAPVRRLLSPAESINAVTVGAAHADGSGAVPSDDRLEPMADPDMPSVASANGGGVRRAVKPDILLEGGRQLVRLEPDQGDGRRLVTIPPSRRAPGVRMAAPGRQAGILDAAVHGAGTSVAAALAGHHAGRLLDTFDWLRGLYGDDLPGPDLDAVLLKAALVHGARWGSARDAVYEMQKALALSRPRDAVSKFVGYGRAVPGRALVCDDHLVTVVAGGWIAKDQAHSYRFPLPPSLASRTDKRRVTLTLAWLTPVNPRHRSYRRAALKLEPHGPSGILGERTDADMHGARRGTVQHEVLEGERAVPYAPGSAVELTVSCRADAGALEVDVPYALLASVEIPEAVGLPIYEEVRQALQVPVGVRTAVRA